MFYRGTIVLVYNLFLASAVVLHTLWWFRHGRAQTVHVVASVTIIAEQQLVLEQKENTQINRCYYKGPDFDTTADV